MTVLWPVCFNEELLESEVQQCETGNGIYISKDEFSNYMSEETGEFIALELKFNNISAYCHIIGTHNIDSEMIFAPGWVCNLLGANSGEVVSVQRAYPSMGTKITIKPKNTNYSKSADPVEALRNAFESYSCLVSGIEIPMMVNGEILDVAILHTSVVGPICIRGVELEVEIASENTPDVNANHFVEDDFAKLEPLIPVPKSQPSRFQGVGRVLGTGKKVMPEQ